MNDRGRPKAAPETPGAASTAMLRHGPDNPVEAKLYRLRERQGYFTRAELEAALGIPSPRPEWVCPGQFGPDGKWMPHDCEEGAA